MIATVAVALAPSSGGGSERNRFGKFGCQVAEAPIRLFFFQSNILGPVCLPLPQTYRNDTPHQKFPWPKTPPAFGSFNKYVDKERWVSGQ